MTNQTAGQTEEIVERHILVAVDRSENAKRAVQFVGDFFGCYPGFRVTLLHAVLEPDAGYFADEQARREWMHQRQTEGETLLAEYRQLLIDSGFKPDKIDKEIATGRGSSVADIIIREQECLSCCAIVIGRRGISKKEEFIFGSTSNKILHSTSHCAVMVIE
ncbi:MAG: universal stress protein [Desulfurivibrionaceae bacterium]